MPSSIGTSVIGTLALSVGVLGTLTAGAAADPYAAASADSFWGEPLATVGMDHVSPALDLARTEPALTLRAGVSAPAEETWRSAPARPSARQSIGWDLEGVAGDWRAVVLLNAALPGRMRPAPEGAGAHMEIIEPKRPLMDFEAHSADKRYCAPIGRGGFAYDCAKFRPFRVEF